LVNVSTGRLIAQVGLGDIGDTSTVAWSHDGRFLAVGTYDGTLTLRDAATLKPLVDAGPVEPGSLTSASFAPDDKTLVTAGTSGALNFWSVPDLSREGGRVIIGNGANNGGVLAWFDAAGNVVGLASDERKPNTDLQRWFTFNAQPASLLSTACGLAGADITRVEWARYVGDRPYRPVCLGHR
jgi:WD40 repeat protein